MSGTLRLSIKTPQREFYNGEVIEIITENQIGKIGILHDHTPMITNIVPSITTIKQADGKNLNAFTSSGVLSIINNNVELLCDTCEWPEEIDLVRAQEAKKRAEERLEKATETELDHKRASLALKRAVSRIRIKE